MNPFAVIVAGAVVAAVPPVRKRVVPVATAVAGGALGVVGAAVGGAIGVVEAVVGGPEATEAAGAEG